MPVTCLDGNMDSREGLDHDGRGKEPDDAAEGHEQDHEPLSTRPTRAAAFAFGVAAMAGLDYCSACAESFASPARRMSISMSSSMIFAKRLLHSSTSSSECICTMQKPPMSSFDSANGPSITVRLPLR